MDNPKRWQVRSSIVVVAAILCAFTIVGSGVALTSGDSQNPATKPRSSMPTANELKVFKQVLLNPLRQPESLVAEAAGALKPSPVRASRKIKPSIYASAIDGEFAYLARTTRTIDTSSLDDDTIRLSTEIVRQNTVSGESTRVFYSGNSIVTAMAASGGRVAASIIRTSETRRSFLIESTVLGAGSADPSMTVTANRRLRVSGDFQLCGSLLIVNGVADDGDALASAVSGDCETGEDLKSSLLKLHSPDAIQTLLPDQAFVDSVIGRPRLVAGKLLSPSRFEQAFGTTQIDSGDFNALWQGQSFVSDMAPDGSVALIGRPQAIDFLGFLFPVRYERKLPLMHFPQGDANRAEMLSRSAGKVVALKFCGSSLYAIKKLSSRSNGRESEPPLEIELVANSFFSNAQFKVLAFDPAAPVREVGNTPRLNLSSLGCSVDGLVLTATRGNRATYLRYK